MTENGDIKLTNFIINIRTLKIEMKKLKKLIIACDGESASGKSTAAKLISKKYGLLLVNSGLLYRYASKLVINHKPKN